MPIRRLDLRNFRNIRSLTISPHSAFNIFVGHNAQGKTNILEAIYLLSFGKSFRLQDHRELILKGEVTSLIRADVGQSDFEEEHSILLTQESKEFFKNKKPASSHQFLSIPLVLFSPDSILMLKENPQARRDYFDDLFSKLSPVYRSHLRRYKKALSQRNNILKNNNTSVQEKEKHLLLWEGGLVEYGIALMELRGEWTKRLNEILRPYYNIFTGGADHGASFQYKKNVEPQNFETTFQERRFEEIQRKNTLVGPHRDDLLPFIKEEPMKSFGSQGELRSMAIALKLSEIKLYEEVLETEPLFLLDDVFSELDEGRHRHFLNYLKNFKGQVFVSTTAIDLIPKGVLKEYGGWEVKLGELSILRGPP